MIQIPDGARRILEKLRSAGFEAYVVGGCVRDSLLGRTPKDWDICTSAAPARMQEALREFRMLETGLRHGTLTVFAGGEQYEVTAFRIDGTYSDGRHPDQVRFTSRLEDDLARRDFTINAMAYGLEGRLIDPFHGTEDLAAGVLRCVGEPDRRFQEDGLRILRALRFGAACRFQIEAETATAIHRNGGLLARISQERIREELCKLLTGPGALRILMEYSDIFSEIIPELAPCIGFAQKNACHPFTVYEHLARAVSSYTGDDISVKLALLLHDIGKPLCFSEDETGGHFYQHSVKSGELAERILARLKFSNQVRAEVLTLIQYHDADLSPSARSVRRWLNQIGPVCFQKLLEVRRADILAQAEDRQTARLARCDEIAGSMAAILAQKDCFTREALAINGKDIVELGVPQGPAVGALLAVLLERVISGELENSREALLRAAAQLAGELESSVPPPPSG